jgi:hypothetical protein
MNVRMLSVDGDDEGRWIEGNIKKSWKRPGPKLGHRSINNNNNEREIKKIKAIYFYFFIKCMKRK